MTDEHAIARAFLGGAASVERCRAVVAHHGPIAPALEQTLLACRAVRVRRAIGRYTAVGGGSAGTAMAPRAITILEAPLVFAASEANALLANPSRRARAFGVVRTVLDRVEAP